MNAFGPPETRLVPAYKEVGDGLSPTPDGFHAGLCAALRQPALAANAQWLLDNLSALQSSNEFVDQRGVPLAQYRNF